mmetsp:Transcript_29503/g.61481  ORF Transcript_29503/g.61481 Transcript_29503/m.61481 type:complete len:85 (+) Transcript_29503:534-788(+)
MRRREAVTGAAAHNNNNNDINDNDGGEPQQQRGFVAAAVSVLVRNNPVLALASDVLCLVHSFFFNPSRMELRAAAPGHCRPGRP